MNSGASGARLRNQFDTINQEYHRHGFITLPGGSGLYLKDQTGKDKSVGQLVKKDGALAWSSLKPVLIQTALRKNAHFHRS